MTPAGERAHAGRPGAVRPSCVPARRLRRRPAHRDVDRTGRGEGRARQALASSGRRWRRSAVERYLDTLARENGQAEK